jgi:Protein of unknown function (DUF2497)
VRPSLLLKDERESSVSHKPTKNWQVLAPGNIAGGFDKAVSLVGISPLHPMLKSWLDGSLPDVIERMVQAEIECVTRGCQLLSDSSDPTAGMI